MEDTPFIVAMVSTIGFVLYTLVVGALGGDHHGGHGSHDGHGVGDGWGLLQFISLQAILLALMSYSWSWLYWGTLTESEFLQAGATALSGSAMTALYGVGMRLIRKLNTTDTIEAFKPVVGMQGTVYLSIPSAGSGAGQVTFLDPKKGDFQVDAMSASDEAIETGSLVVVTETSSLSVTVRKV